MLDMQAHQDWSFPIPIAYGAGRLADIGRLCQDQNIARPLIVTDAGSQDLPFIAQTIAFMETAGLSPSLFHAISPNPRDDEIEAGCEVYRQGQHDAVVAIGGGSAMDGGKAIAMTANSGVPLWDFEYSQTAPRIPNDRPFPTLITIPTTAGTGAETESTAMVTHTEKGMKFCLAHEGLKPALALLDPQLTVGLPANLTAWTGVDALVHAIEAYLVPSFNPLCDGLALEGLALVWQWLPTAVNEPENLEARGGMLVGSCLAGIAFLKGLGLVHAISHMVGAEYNTHHGLTNAIALPTVLRFNLPGQEDKVAVMARAMDLPDQSVEGFIAAIEHLLDELQIPKSLSDIGVPEDCVNRIADKAAQDDAAATNPRLATIEELRELTSTAIRAGRA